MLKKVALLGCLVAVATSIALIGKQFNGASSEDFLTWERLLPAGVLLPKGQRGVPKACIDAPFGRSPGMSEIKKNSRNELYMCAFANFQYRIGDSKRSAPYTNDTVEMRFELFKNCVDGVNEQNRRFKAGLETSMAGINFSCDMTAWEVRPYESGLTPLDSDDLSG